VQEKQSLLEAKKVAIEEMPVSKPRRAKAQPTCVEFFCGGGGLAVGLAASGFRHLGLFDSDEAAIHTINANTDFLALCTDLRQSLTQVTKEFEDEQVDLFAAGPPCQPFSMAGKRHGAKDRRNLFPEVFLAIAKLQPKIVLIENVHGLLWGDGQAKTYADYVEKQLCFINSLPEDPGQWVRHFRRLEKLCTKADYCVNKWVLNAADFGVAQTRKRAFLVATRSDFLDKQIKPPIPTHTSQSNNRVPNGRLPWVTVRDVLSSIEPPGAPGSQKNHSFVPGARTYKGHTGSRLDAPSKTITAGTHGVAGGQNTLVMDDGSVRYFTLYECQLLQGFPGDFEFCGSKTAIYRQIGNAVPPPLAKAVGDVLMKAISQTETVGGFA
jgi:DNA (cytosine-5)-methyltransferase 1